MRSRFLVIGLVIPTVALIIFYILFFLYPQWFPR